MLTKVERYTVATYPERVKAVMSPYPVHSLSNHQLLLCQHGCIDTFGVML